MLAPVSRAGRMSLLACLVSVSAAHLACDAAPGLPAPQTRYSKLVVFGASLCDVGNFRARFAIAPAPPYWCGRFTDGFVWVEHLATRLGLSARPSALGGRNFAIGLAMSGEGCRVIAPLLPSIPNLLEQIRQYTDSPDGTELFVIWAGINDAIESLADESEAASQQRAVDAAGNVARAVSRLALRGGRRFLVADLPDLGRAPLYAGSALRQRASDWSARFNAEWERRLTEVQPAGAVIYRLRTSELYERWLQSPPEGISELAEPAWRSSLEGLVLGYLAGGRLAPAATAHFWWDLVHPGQIVHRALGEAAAALVVSESAEPARTR